MDAKYRARKGRAPKRPGRPGIASVAALGPALDLAAGRGGTRCLLASRQQVVTAVDSSSVALEILEQRAADLHCAVAHIKRPAQIGNRWAGFSCGSYLEELSLPSEGFSLVICVNYLQRSLFSQIERTLRLRNAIVRDVHGCTARL